MSTITETRINYGFMPEITAIHAPNESESAQIALLQSIVIGMNAKLDVLLKTITPDTSRSNDDYFHEWLNTKKSLSASTNEQYRLTVGAFIRSLGDKHVLTADVNDVTAFVGTKRHLKAASVNNIIINIKTFYSYLSDKNYLKAGNPAAFIALSKQTDTTRMAMTLRQVEMLFNVAVVESDYMLISVLYGFALRISEALKLTPSMIDFAGHQINIPATKNGTTAHKSMSIDLMELLKAYIEKNGIQADSSIFPISDDKANDINLKLMKMANVYLSPDDQITQKLTNHIWRHTAATHLEQTNGIAAV